MKRSNKYRLMSVALVKFFTILFVFIFLTFPVNAEQKCEKAKGPKPVGAANSSNGGVFSKGKYGVIFKYFYFKQDQLYNGTDEVDFIRPQKGQKGKKAYEKTVQDCRLTLRTGISDNFDARLIIPFLDKEMKRMSFKNDFTDSNSSIGDIKLISRYRIMSQKKKDPFNLAVGAGLKMPTGETDEKDSSGKTPGFLQTGSGSWDPIVELGAHKVMGQHWLSSHLIYLITSKGDLGDYDFEKPDVFKYNFAYAYALSYLFDLGLELNGVVKSKAEKDGIRNDNSGGHVIYLSPEIHFKFRKGMHLDLCVPISVYRDLNGTQLSEDYRVVVKLAMTF